MFEDTFLNNNNVKIKPSRWLNTFARNVTSQWGEDGIIEKALEVIKDINKWCVEFGSWDGKTHSNTFNLIDKKDYSAVSIEGDSCRFQALLKTFEGNKKVTPLNTFVGFEESNCLDSILKTTEIPTNFDLLSIDIDGNDYHVWQAVKQYKPKLVVIECNPSIPNPVEFVQPRDMRVTQGSSLLSIVKLAKTKGYELVAVTKSNGIFVDLKYFDLFGIKDNSVAVMRTDDSLITHIFFGYDGKVFIRGCGELPWQKIRLKESKMQHLPKWARKQVGDRNILRRRLGSFVRRRLRKKSVV